VTHDIAEGLELATHVAILSSGRLVESGPRSGDLAAYRRRYAEATGG